ncbi:N-acetylglucosaminyldiphosphoundecaprenol N-acetyl-beta-D-mannosaminyltransferase [Methylobacterium crusticola]|uniref:N-acetylglucosaminyldiphosphoundecaprenol N-acetyl-beta-D-mannosaminyltransferase n=1 Tax=Methylobacterium crusticola TaxID=1697972 RepID=A0ABQ4R4F7_9HYPH|nr:WecB/TagA/CpsF family glycosyltransferase [Methylobacterium crusticola]GJD52181.1 N-acetylglucosaminyldiphosphoundecaprenol N-acetyl-beta-D-mannosaminyltransferase [Methylobacterium crusticola]
MQHQHPDEGRTAGAAAMAAAATPAPATAAAAAPASLSLIVCTLGRRDTLERLLESLRAQTRRPLEILVVDQNPAGYLHPLLARYQDLPLVHLVDLADARGLSRARNLGLTIARGDVVGFPDDDCWYDPGVVETVSRLFGRDGRHDLVTGRTADAEGADSVSRHLPVSGEITRANVFLAGNSNGLFVRRTLASRVGGFDEALGVGAATPYQSGEESDFILRCLAAGGGGRFERGLIVRHARTDGDPAAAATRARRYAPGFGRVLRLHGFPAGFVAGRLARAVGRGTLCLLAGRTVDARQRYAWAAGTARGYLSPAGAPRLGRGAPAAAPRQPRPAFGLRFTPLGEQELAARIVGPAVPRGAGPRVIATANLDHIVQLSRSTAFRQAYGRAWAVTADGMPVYLYARLRGAAVPARLTGADLFARVMTSLSPERHRCFFVATTQETAGLIEQDLVRRGFAPESLAFRVPPHGFETDQAYSDGLAEAIRAHRATHLFVGVGSPKSEIWIDRYRTVLSDCYVLSVGAALEFFVGTKRRAPPAIQHAGLEWAWRVAHEPRRLFRRYFVDSWRFLWLVGADVVRPGSDITLDGMNGMKASNDA